MILGFGLAAYAVVANDSIQTLGTFISSNAHRRWWVLWAYVSGVMVLAITVGWFMNSGDPAFGLLSAGSKAIPFPVEFTWHFVLPPLCLVVLTKFGVPVSTSLLVLTAFRGLVAAQNGKGGKSAEDLFASMMSKSLSGYAIAFVLGLVVFYAVLYVLERKIYAQREGGKEPATTNKWVVFQWLSTGFLWSMWLAQDLANIFCYLPRTLHGGGLVLSLGGLVLMQGYIFYRGGGKIQDVVKVKTNTLDVRSACFIDLIYGVVLLFFKMDILGIWPAKLPMSTTWVFLGLLAGREFGLMIRMRHREGREVRKLVLVDFAKVTAGSVIAFALAWTLPKMITPKVVDSAGVEEAVVEPQSR